MNFFIISFKIYNPFVSEPNWISFLESALKITQSLIIKIKAIIFYLFILKTCVEDCDTLSNITKSYEFSSFKYVILLFFIKMSRFVLNTWLEWEIKYLLKYQAGPEN